LWERFSTAIYSIGQTLSDVVSYEGLGLKGEGGKKEGENSEFGSGNAEGGKKRRWEVGKVKKVRSKRISIQYQASSIQHPVSSIPASSIQYPVSSIQHPAIGG
jgi:hypothetical protein